MEETVEQMAERSVAAVPEYDLTAAEAAVRDEVQRRRKAALAARPKAVEAKTAALKALLGGAADAVAKASAAAKDLAAFAAARDDLTALATTAKVPERTPGKRVDPPEPGGGKKISAAAPADGPAAFGLAGRVLKPRLQVPTGSLGARDKRTGKALMAQLKTAAEAFKKGPNLVTAIALVRGVQKALDHGESEVALQAELQGLLGLGDQTGLDLQATVGGWWAQEVVPKGASITDVQAVILTAQRGPTERLAAFVARMRPMAELAAGLGAMAENVTVGHLLETKTLGATYRADNAMLVREAPKDTMAELYMFATARAEDEKVAAVAAAPSVPQPAVATAPVTVAGERPREGRVGGTWRTCHACGEKGHLKRSCPTRKETKEAEGAKGPKAAVKKEATPAAPAKPTNKEASGDDYSVASVRGRLGGREVTLGADSYAGANVVRQADVPPGTPVLGPGPALVGVGSVGATQKVRLQVAIGPLPARELEFLVVPDLPVAALVGWKALGAMGCVLDPGLSQIRAGKTVIPTGVRVALPAITHSDRPAAVAYWHWLAQRMARAPKETQVKFQSLMERADDGQLAAYADGFEAWARDRLEQAGRYDPAVHPAPRREELCRPTKTKGEVATGAVTVACPVLLPAAEIFPPTGPRMEETLDGRPFLHPVMSDEEDQRLIGIELKRIVREAELSSEEKAKLAALLEEYRDVFGNFLRSVNTDQERVSWKFKGPIQGQPRRIIRDPRIAAAVNDWLQEYIKRGLVQKSTKTWAVNLLPIVRDGKLRITADLRPWNDAMERDHYPIPSPLEALDRMRAHVRFSTFDETDSYYQYPLAEGCEAPFYGPDGDIYEFVVMPQGAKNSPAELHRRKQRQFAAFNPKELAYMFDDTILGSDLGGHLELVRRFLHSCRVNKTILKPKKVHIARSRVKHQGFIMRHGVYEKDPVAVQPLVDMPMPKNASELRSQMSMIGHYRRFIAHYAQLAAPLEAIMSARWGPDTWRSHHEVSMTALRRELAKSTMLTMPNWNLPMVWRVDSGPTTGIAAVVGQMDKEGQFYPIRFLAKKASDADRRRWPLEMEALGWYWALYDKGRDLAMYSKNIIIGDPLPLHRLRDVLAQARPNRSLWNVAAALQSLDITFLYRPREEMVDVDTLGRFVSGEPSDEKRLKEFLQADAEVPEIVIPVAPALAAGREVPVRLQQDGAQEFALGEPVDAAAAQANDGICSFIMAQLRKGAGFSVRQQRREMQELTERERAALGQYFTKTGSRRLTEFEIRNGLLFKKIKQDKMGDRLVLVLPRTLTKRVLAAVHDAPSAGHPGVNGTLFAVKRSFFWFGMTTDVKSWVETCDVCRRFKQRNIVGHGSHRWGSLQPIRRAPWERLAIDTIGPLATTATGKKYVLTMMDTCSGETMLEALESRDAMEIADAVLRRVVLSGTCPKVVQSDRAPELTGRVLTRLLERAGVRAKQGTAFEAHVNGAVEKRNHSVGLRLAMMAEAEGDKHAWDEWLPFVQHSINHQVYSPTGMTPYFFRTGHDGVQVAEAWTAPLREDEPIPMRVWVKRMRAARAMAQLGHAAAADAAKERYDQEHPPHPFEEGSRVAVWFPKGDKLDAPTLGPYVIKDFVDAARRTARVHPEGAPEQLLVVHVDRLSAMPGVTPAEWVERRAAVEAWSKLVEDPVVQAPPAAEQEADAGPDEAAALPEEDVPAVADEDVLPDVIEDPNAESEADDQREWPVEAIIGWQETADGRRQYLVRFAGYGPEKDRYYDEEDLRVTMPRELEAYEQEVERELAARQQARMRPPGTRSRRLRGLEPE